MPAIPFTRCRAGQGRCRAGAVSLTAQGDDASRQLAALLRYAHGLRMLQRRPGRGLNYAQPLIVTAPSLAAVQSECRECQQSCAGADCKLNSSYKS